MQKTHLANPDLLIELLEQSNTCSFIIDIQTSNIIYCNSAASKLIGIPEEKIYNHKAWEILPFHKEYEHRLAGIDLNDTEYRLNEENVIKLATGEEIPIEINSKIIKNEHTNYLLLTFNLIIYKKKLEEQSKLSQEFYKLLIENSPECFFIVNADGKFIYANNSTIKSLGYELSELIDLTYKDISDPLDLPRYDKDFMALVSGRAKIIKTRGKLISKDKKLRIFDFTSINLLDHPKAKGILVIGHEITTIVEYEEKLIRINKTYQNIINNIPFPMYISDWDSRILFANEIYAHNLNRSLDDCLGKTYEELGFDQNLIRKHMEEERQILIEFKSTDPQKHDYINPFTNEINTYLIKKAPIIYEDQTAILCISIDITELERTKDLLIENNQALEKVNQELDRFIYAASHELRSPVTTIQGIINLAKEESSIECLHEYIYLISENVKRQDKITRDLISFTKNVEQEVSIEPINFSAMVNAVLENLTHIKQYKKVNIYTSIQQDIPFHSDSLRLDLILRNLISNALKYCKTNIPNPYLEINITAEPKSAVINITDNGIGIESEKQDKIFNMFYRATDKEHGTGLGLYLTKEAVKKINGQIMLTSALDLGTKFTVILPNLADTQNIS